MPWPIIRPAPSASPLRHAVCLLLSTSLLTACATLPGEPVARQSIERSAARAYYSGPLDWEGVHRLQALAQGVRIRVLEVDSQGGEAEPAMALGYWLHGNQINLEVNGRCLGSCANYLFPAAAKKLIQPGSIVAWQGNLHLRLQQQERPQDFTPRPTLLDASGLTALRQQVSLEQTFFSTIGVDERLCWIGKLPPYRVPGYYVMPPEDLRRFGVREVRTEQDYSARSAARWSAAFPVQKVVLPFGGAL